MKKLLLLLAIGQFYGMDCLAGKKKLVLGTLSQQDQTVHEPEQVKEDTFDLEKIVQQAAYLENMKDDIHKIVESCFDLISQEESQKRDQLHKWPKPESKQKIEDRVDSFLRSKLMDLRSKLLHINKTMVNDILNHNHKPCHSVNFAE